MRVYSTKPLQEHAPLVAPVLKDLQSRVEQVVRGSPLGPHSTFWDLLDAARAHPWLRAAIASIGRSVVGTGWHIGDVDGETPTDSGRKALQEFYANPPDRDFVNLQDLYTTANKLYLTAACLRLFGVAAWQPIRNGLGKAVGFDYVWGVVEPNIDAQGNFQSPAWRVYASRKKQYKPKEYANPADLVVFFNPDFGGRPYSSDLEALVPYSLPSDIWAMLSYLKLHSERSAPYDGFWIVPQDVDNDTFEMVQALLYARYAGGDNFARTPIVAKGDLDFKPTRRGEDEAPYREGRQMSRQEITGVVGTTGAQLGVTDDMTRSNLAQIRKQTHEMTILPILRIIEEAAYVQVSIREFSEPGSALRFNPPDFLTVLERAGVAFRLRDRGALSSNEMRDKVWNMPPKEGGDDDWLYPSNMVNVGGLAGGSPQNPGDKPADDVGDDGGDNASPPRTDDPDQHRDNLALALHEIKQWKRFYNRMAGGKRPPRQFVAKHIPPDLYDMIDTHIEAGAEREFVMDLFDAAVEAVSEQCT